MIPPHAPVVRVACALAALSLGSPPRPEAAHAEAAIDAPVAAAAARREELFERYAAMLAELRNEIAARLPAVDARQRDAFLATYAAEATVDPDPGAYPTLVAAQAVTLAAAAPILAALEPFLASDALDAQLMRGAVVANATPHALADFAARGAQQAAMVEQLLADPDAMRDMLVAGGAKAGNYPKALEILAAIRQASERARERDGVLARLALGTALEHAVPVKGDSAVDPVQRYLAYEAAYLAGELDPAFAGLTAWECRFVTNDPFTDAEHAWVRAMLRNYRPDAILEPDYKWRYVRIVRTDVTYKTPEWGAVAGTKAAQLINGGGKCGPRAWFGRLALRAFGIPTWGVRQKGHAALAHWTPGGWTTNFGAAWQHNWWEDRGGPDFVLETRARTDRAAFLRSLRADWIGDVLGEAKVDGRRSGKGGLWHALARNQWRAIATAAATAAASPAPAAGAASGPRTLLEALQASQVTDADRAIAVGADGAITIPAVACTASRDSAKKLVSTKSFAGGMQLHVERLTEPVDFEYSVDVPKAGRYALVARVVTVHKDQHLWIAVGDAPEPVDVALPYTAGMWQDTDAVTLDLEAGSDVLRCRVRAPHNGVTIDELRLVPTR